MKANLMPGVRALAMTCAIFLGTAPAAAWAQGRAASVLVETVEIRAIADTTPILGQFVASTQADVASRRSGIVENVMFEIGDRVLAGEPLVRLDTRLTEIERRTVAADLGVARAGIETAQARVVLAEQSLARQERLKDSTAFSKGTFEDLLQQVAVARGQLAEASAQFGSAEARLARVDYDLEHAVIKAPYTGIVVERMAQPGQYLNIGEAVGTLLDVEGLEIEADVPEELARGLSVGMEVQTLFADATAASAQVRVLLPVETISTRTRPIRFSVDTGALDASLLAIGKSITLQVPVSAPRDVVTVPKDALVQGRGGGWMVYVVADEKAEPRPVTLGQAAGSRMEVINGLGPGDIVVVRGNERLRPGQAVNPTVSGG